MTAGKNLFALLKSVISTEVSVANVAEKSGLAVQLHADFPSGLCASLRVSTSPLFLSSTEDTGAPLEMTRSWALQQSKNCSKKVGTCTAITSEIFCITSSHL